MAITFGAAQNAQNSATSTINVTLAGVTSGDLLVATTRCNAAVTVTISDDQGTTWTQVINEINSGDVAASQHYAVATVTGTFVITATFSSSTAVSLVASRFTGTTASVPLDGWGGDTADSTTNLNVNFDPGQNRSGANCVIVSGIAGPAGTTWTAPTSFTIPTNGSNGRSAQAYRIMTTADSVTADWGLTPSASPSGTIAAYLESVGGGGGGTKPRMMLLGVG